jgi:putative FmdB family regulatory protein
MPTYDYACAACGHRFEVIHGVHASGPESCPNCGHAPVRKAVSAPSVVFKGSGWAKLDRRTSAAKKAGTGTDEASKPAATTDGGSDKSAGAASTDKGGSTAADKGGSTTSGSDTGKPSSAPSGSTAGGSD